MATSFLRVCRRSCKGYRAAPCRAQRGFLQNFIVPGIILILPSLILMGVVLAGWSSMMNQNQVGINIGRSVDVTRTQLDQIQRALNWCRIVYPAGNNGTGFRPNMPGSPADGSWVPLRTVVCPGESDKTLWEAAREPLQMQGLYLEEWEYRNIASGAYIRIRAEAERQPDGTYLPSQFGSAVLTQVSYRIHPTLLNLTDGALVVLVVN